MDKRLSEQIAEKIDPAKRIAFCYHHMGSALRYMAGGRATNVRLMDVSKRDDHKCSCGSLATWKMTEIIDG